MWARLFVIVEEEEEEEDRRVWIFESNDKTRLAHKPYFVLNKKRRQTRRLFQIEYAKELFNQTL